MNCSACGADNRGGAKFCHSCGQRLLEAEVPASAGIVEVEEGAIHRGERSELAFYDENEPDEPLGAVTGEAAFEAGSEKGNSDIAEEPPVVAVEGQEQEGILGFASQPSSQAQEDVLAGDGESLESEDQIVAFWREESERMIPVEVGTVIEDRYAVVETLDLQEDEILYRAFDLQRCWQCGHEENDPEGAFCARCGVLMDRRPDVQLLELRQAGGEPPPDKVVVSHLNHNSRHFLLLAEQQQEAEPKPEMPSKPACFRLLVGQRSDPGHVRELDEDSLFVLTLAPTYQSRTGPVLGLFAVADGMGGHAGGEVASKMALQVLVERVLQTVIICELSGELVLEEDILALLRQATIAANDGVYLARKKRDNDMGTTLSTAFIRDDRLFLAHVGDGRIYRFNADGLEQLTTDHSVVASMIADGQAKPEEIYSHPHRSIVTRCIGDKPVVEVDTDILPLAPGDRVILCCDGVWEMVRDEGIEDVMMQEADPQAACDLLVRRANAAGGDDNISVIVVQVDSVQDIDT